ncbi:MAG TPA: type II toxin-antitoxin system VapC family toxin, partial [Gemmataceae bacterium]|nr:type II toxin-antitoxin system VapC family toxin [Gemmataceae bacterium]
PRTRRIRRAGTAAVIYLLDTNAWIAYLRQNSQVLVQRLQQEPPSDVGLCSVVLGELWYGAVRSGPVHLAANFALIARLRQQFISLPFDDPAAEEYRRIRAHLAGQGTMIGPNDLMIAAIALTNQLTLVTHNTAEFSRVPGLTLEDWQ